LEALRRVPTVRLPDGSAFPTSEYPLEMVLLMSSYTGKSDEDADSWLATIVKLTAEQIATLQSSDLMEDNVTILCDGFWRREFAKSVVERDWDRLADKLKQIEATGTQAGFPLLAAAAIRTQILVLAEWQLRLEDAVALSESALARFDRDDSRFLVLEVTGRHISYAGQSERAIPWLERALACDAYRYSLWRRDVLITLAELNGATAPQTAVDLTAQAISVADGPQGYEQGIGEALAEHGIALWKAGDRRSAFTTFEKAVDRYLTAPSDSELWKGSFFRLFASLVYFSDVMKWGQPREGHQEPLQGAFLASQELHLSYRGEQRSYICSRLATYAEGLDEIVRAAHWIARAVGYAREYPAAWADIRFSCVLALPSALVANDFNRAAETAALVSKTELDQVPAQAEPIVAALATAPTANAGEMEGVVAAATPEIHNKGFLIHPFVPIAVRLATLSVSSATPEQIAGYLAQIDNHVPVDHAPLGFTADLRRGLIDREDWHSLHREGFEAVSGNELVHGYVLCIGAMLNAPVPAALYLQTMLAQHLEGFAASAPSVYRHVIAPMFRAYWERVIDTSVVLFHTSLYYTRRQLELADGSPTGTRRFLSAMCTCLRAKMPEETMAWLNS